MVERSEESHSMPWTVRGAVSESIGAMHLQELVHLWLKMFMCEDTKISGLLKINKVTKPNFPPLITHPVGADCRVYRRL